MQATHLATQEQPTTATRYDLQELTAIVDMLIGLTPDKRQRLDKAFALLTRRQLLRQADGSTLVESWEKPGTYYKQTPMCSCPDAQHRKRICCHMEAVQVDAIYTSVMAKRAVVAQQATPAPAVTCIVCKQDVTRLIGGECSACAQAALTGVA